MTAPTTAFWRAEYATHNQDRADRFGAFMNAIVRGEPVDRLADELAASNAVAGYVLGQLIAAVRSERAQQTVNGYQSVPAIPRRSVA